MRNYTTKREKKHTEKAATVIPLQAICSQIERPSLPLLLRSVSLSGGKQSSGVNESVWLAVPPLRGLDRLRLWSLSLQTAALYDPGEGLLAILHKRRVVVGEPRPPFKGAAH